MHCWVLLPAAGTGTRLAAASNGTSKQFLLWQDVPLYWHAARTLAKVARVRGIVVIFPPSQIDTARTELHTLMDKEHLGVEWLCVSGGETRQDSVRNGLEALPRECDTVLIHDAARPFVSPLLPNAVLDALRHTHEGRCIDGVVPALPLTDTVKEVNEAGLVCSTPQRETLRAVQTPQGFTLDILKRCHLQAQNDGWKGTDDASLLERYGYTVLTIEGEESNHKITTPKDLALLYPHNNQQHSCHNMLPCTGFGYDVHRYGGNRPMLLGGVPIPTDITVSAHSDGDVLLHALMDALLGCMGEGDIGQHFPDTDASFDGISSGVLLAEVLRLIDKKGIRLSHVDCTIVAQTPKIAPYRDQIQKNIATLLRLPKSSVAVKATTEEKLGFTGEKLGMKAYAVVSCLKPHPGNPV